MCYVVHQVTIVLQRTRGIVDVALARRMLEISQISLTIDYYL
jgi:hypothetical protein